MSQNRDVYKGTITTFNSAEGHATALVIWRSKSRDIYFKQFLRPSALKKQQHKINKHAKLKFNDVFIWHYCLPCVPSGTWKSCVQANSTWHVACERTFTIRSSTILVIRQRENDSTHIYYAKQPNKKKHTFRRKHLH